MPLSRLPSLGAPTLTVTLPPVPSALDTGSPQSVAIDAGQLEPLLLDVEGMKCGGCVRAVERRLLEQPGVRQASVNLLTRTAWVGLDQPLPAAGADAGDGPVEALVASLRSLGFKAQPRSQGRSLGRTAVVEGHPRWWQEWRQLIVALALLLLSVVGHLTLAGTLPASPLGALWFHALVASIALLGPGRPILVRGALQAAHGLPSMDTLVGLGMGSAYLASLVAFLWPAASWPCFFNEPVMLLGFVLLGRFLEERARFRTGRALEQLAELQPDSALLLLGDGPPRQVPVGGLRAGDRLRLLPGDRIPVDGVVLDGCSAVDVSSFTGEPLPLEAQPGTDLAAGMLNLQAPLVLEVRRAGAETALARIIALVEQAQVRKAPIQSLADRIAGRFSVVVLLLALATFVFWWQWGTRLWPQVLAAAPQGHGGMGGHAVLGAVAGTPFSLALQLAIAVLVVACPCALGLATPTAITVGAGLAARSGLLFRGGDAIEMASRLQTVLFDKTGTLTQGRPEVIAVELATDLDPEYSLECGPERLLQVAASLEQHTRHPLATALLEEAQTRRLPLLTVEDSRTFAGAGVQGQIGGFDGICRVGKPGWLEGLGVRTEAKLLASRTALEAQGATVLAVAAGDVVLGLVGVNDQPRPDAGRTLETLQAMGMDVAILSGDQHQAVRRLGAELGLEPEAMAWELLPEQKLEHLVHWRQRGPVAMVGDGINDAPALAAADLGIAVATGTQIAQDTADLVILGDRLEAVVEALVLARDTMAKVRQNLAWAFGYNLVMLPLAAGLLLPRYGLLLSPPLAALLMATSSITVVLNALSLHGRR